MQDIASCHFFWKNDEILAMPDTLAFFSFSTPCDAFVFALRFFPSSSISSPARDFFFFAGAFASASATSSSFSALICASSVVKLRRSPRC
jgi:hypothetical protein